MSGKGKPAALPEAAATKTQRVIGLLKRKMGVSIEELQAVTGWQAHSMRGRRARLRTLLLETPERLVWHYLRAVSTYGIEHWFVVLGHVDDADVKVILEGNLKGLGLR